MTVALPALVAELDAVYQDATQRLEQQARDAQHLDQRVRRVLNLTTSGAPLFDPRRPMSPRQTFRALAMQIVDLIQTTSGRKVPLATADFDDLLAWPTEPNRPGVSQADEIMQGLAIARQQSLHTFWDRLRLRVTPETDPQRAIAQAIADLLEAFAIPQPDAVVVPYIAMPPQRALSMDLRRQDEDLEWVLSESQRRRMTRANHAIATVCLLNGQPDVAEAIHHTNHQIAQRLQTRFGQYEAGFVHTGTQDIQIAFARDVIAYRLRMPIYERLTDTLATHTAGITFVPALHR